MAGIISIYSASHTASTSKDFPSKRTERILAESRGVHISTTGTSKRVQDHNNEIFNSISSAHTHTHTTDCRVVLNVKFSSRPHNWGCTRSLSPHLWQKARSRFVTIFPALSFEHVLRDNPPCTTELSYTKCFFTEGHILLEMLLHRALHNSNWVKLSWTNPVPKGSVQFWLCHARLPTRRQQHFVGFSSSPTSRGWSGSHSCRIPRSERPSLVTPPPRGGGGSQVSTSLRHNSRPSPVPQFWAIVRSHSSTDMKKT